MSVLCTNKKMKKKGRKKILILYLYLFLFQIVLIIVTCDCCHFEKEMASGKNVTLPLPFIRLFFQFFKKTYRLVLWIRLLLLLVPVVVV